MPTFAAVDIGSNSVRLKIARLVSGRLRAILEDREVTRLGEGVFRSGFLTPESMAETVKVLRRFHRTTQQVVTDSVRVVATSALRDARNSQAFLEWVRSATGWRVEIVSGVEEARLIHLGLVTSPRIDNSPTLMIDLGGGSCELTVSQRGHIRDAVSLPLGAVRLTNEFLPHDPPRKGELKQLRGFIAREVSRVVTRIAPTRIRNVIATSGTAAALAAMATHLRRGRYRERPVVSRAEMKRIAKRLARTSLAERPNIEGIGPRRAEIIVAGAIVYQELLDRLHLKGFRYSPLGLRDGILAQMAADYDRTTRSGRQIESERWESILKAIDHYHIDRVHALDVRESAMFLFSALRSVHRLPPEYREWLSAAAMLYEVGDYVNRNGHHRHTHYIISNSEILGYTPQQRRLIAAIARYLGKSRPASDDGPMKFVDPADRTDVQKAIVLLRLARALNLGRSRAVQKVRIGLHSPEVKLTLVPRRRMGVDLELWAIEKDCSYFREVFGRELSTAVS
ncbi:MAG TPA: Ppx/GppA phosphatase family protein [Verrucomicrobiae bacterium]|jgi:exopolyphosphatase / guanosine-5'-triphosphate,3'-diphosphate pyrophosphatase|nr:Ppx/GppA phosphatase family protein [Verrucomicrobiae bacterium]